MKTPASKQKMKKEMKNPFTTVYCTKHASMAIHAKEEILKKAKELAKTQKTITLGLSGGKSERYIYKLFATSKDPIWKKIHIFFVDERLVAVGNKNCNYTITKKLFLDALIEKGVLPKSNIHHFIEKNTADRGASNYYNELKKYSTSKCFDIIILGAGEDGHVASCFAHHKQPTKQGYWYINDSPKLPHKRVSATLALLEQSKFAILIFLGRKKRLAYKQFISTKTTIDDCPAKIVMNIPEKIVFSEQKTVCDETVIMR